MEDLPPNYNLPPILGASKYSGVGGYGRLEEIKENLPPLSQATIGVNSGNVLTSSTGNLVQKYFSNKVQRPNQILESRPVSRL